MTVSLCLRRLPHARAHSRTLTLSLSHTQGCGLIYGSASALVMSEGHQSLAWAGGGDYKAR